MAGDNVLSALMGALVAGSCVAALFFVRFYAETRDRLFLYFAAAFTLFGVDWSMVALLGDAKEATPQLYLVRVAGFGLILYGVIDKNRVSEKATGAEDGAGEGGKPGDRRAQG